MRSRIIPTGLFFFGTASLAFLGLTLPLSAAPPPPPQVQFSSSTYSVAQSDGQVTVTVIRTGKTTSTSTVDYETSDGTATAGSDYTAVSGTLLFARKQTSQTFTVPITQNTTAEGNLTFNVTLSNPSGATLGSPSSAVVTIIDTDCAPAPPDLVSWWPAEGSANDIVNHHNGTLEGSVDFAGGKVGTAFSFDGDAANHVSVPANASLDLTQFTVDAWVYPTGKGNAGYIVDKTDDNGTNYYLALTSDNALEFGFYDPNIHFVDSTNLLPANSWTHVAGTYDGTTLKVYVNGTLDGSLAYSGTPPGGQPIKIGVRSNISFPFQGLIDEVEIFSRALLDSEILSIFSADSAGKCRSCVDAPANLISWWPGDGNGNDIVNQNNLNLGGATFVTGEVRQAFNFDGSQAASPGLPSNLNITGDQLTLDGWINPNSAKEGVYFGKSESSQNDYTLFFLGGDLTSCIKTADNVEHFFHTGYVPPNGEWQHIALTYDGSTQIVYVNGIAIGQQSVSGNIKGDNVNFWIGGRSDSLRVDAAIDEVEVFDRALSADEIQTIYDAGSLGKCKPPAPATPVAQPATNVGRNGFTANWNTAMDATGYQLDVSTSKSFDTYVSGYENLDVGNTTSFNVTGLSARTTYYYRVRAYNDIGVSDNSNIVSVKTKSH